MGVQKPLGKTPLRGNPSPEMIYLPTSVTSHPIKETGVRLHIPRQTSLLFLLHVKEHRNMGRRRWAVTASQFAVPLFTMCLRSWLGLVF